jgi:hypothetical protein
LRRELVFRSAVIQQAGSNNSYLVFGSAVGELGGLACIIWNAARGRLIPGNSVATSSAAWVMLAPQYLNMSEPSLRVTV